MKKLGLALMASAAAVFGFGLVAQAGYVGDQSVTVNPAVASPGQQVDVTYNNCIVGETVDFVTNFASINNVPCEADAAFGLSLLMAPSLGSATATFTAPSPGSYPGTASPIESPALPFTIVVQGADTTVAPTTVAPTTAAPTTTDGAVTPPTPAPTPAPSIPATGGGEGASTITYIAIGLLVVGAGLFIVAQVRRREQAPAA